MVVTFRAVMKGKTNEILTGTNQVSSSPSVTANKSTKDVFL